MICNSRFQKRLCRVACRPMPIPVIVLIDPRCWTAAGVVFAGAQFNINFVTARAFYPALLTVCHPVSSAYITTPRSTSHGASDTLGGVIAPLSLNRYALRWRAVFPLTSESSLIKQVINTCKTIFLIPSMNGAKINSKYLTPFSKRPSRISNLYSDIRTSISALLALCGPPAIIRTIISVVINAIDG